MFCHLCCAGEVLFEIPAHFKLTSVLTDVIHVIHGWKLWRAMTAGHLNIFSTTWRFQLFSALWFVFDVISISLLINTEFMIFFFFLPVVVVLFFFPGDLGLLEMWGRTLLNFQHQHFQHLFASCSWDQDGETRLFSHHVYKLCYRFADDVTTLCRTADVFMCVGMLVKCHILRALMGMYSSKCIIFKDRNNIYVS